MLFLWGRWRLGRWNLIGDGTVAAEVVPDDSSSSASFSPIRASPMSRSHSLFSFCWHRRSRAWTVAGAPCGSADQFGSLLMSLFRARLLAPEEKRRLEDTSAYDAPG